MFGREKTRRKKFEERVAESRRQAEIGNEAARQQREESGSQPGSADQEMQATANSQVEDMRKTREEGYASGRQRAGDLFSRDVQGFTPRQRQGYEESAANKMNKQMQGYQRQLIAKQGGRGIKGGAAYAQQADLAKAGMENQSQYLRDINLADSDMAIKKTAATFGIEQGEGAQYQLDKQLAYDRANMDDQKKRQGRYGTKFTNDYFTRA